MKYTNIILVTLFSIFIQDIDMVDEKIMLTVVILLPLFTIIDFVVNIVNKKYSHKILFFYIRMYTIMMICAMIGANDFFSGNVGYEILTLMVMVTYISLFIIIFSSLLNVNDIKDYKIAKDITFSVCNETHIEKIKISYGEMEANHISLDKEAYSIVALKGNEVIGFISSYLKPLTPPLEGVHEAYINIIEVKEELRRIGIGTKLLEKTENHFRLLGIYQIRGWSSQEKLEAINLWRKLQFSLCPTLIHLPSKDLNVPGYYFIKKYK